MIKTIKFNGKKYPLLQAQSNAAAFALPFAKKLLSGKGLDIGCNRKEWSFPDSIMIDVTIEDEWNANNLPKEKYDYIFSSHCLEHVPDWVGTLDYWTTRLKTKGILFLYLPHYSQEYWRPWNNRKHISVLTSEIIKDYLENREWCNIFVTEGYDLNNSFYAVAEKR